MRVLVVGAGVIGLTVGVRLAEAGYDTHILGRELPLETTSAVAAALWYPYRIDPIDRVLPWSIASLREFEAHRRRRGVRGGASPRHRALRQPSADPWWSSAVPDLKRVAHVPPALSRCLDVRRAGHRDAGVPGLAAGALRAGGRRRHPDGAGRAAGPSEQRGHRTVVVNCSGIGSRALAAIR